MDKSVAHRHHGLGARQDGQGAPLELVVANAENGRADIFLPRLIKIRQFGIHVWNR